MTQLLSVCVSEAHSLFRSDGLLLFVLAIVVAITISSTTLLLLFFFTSRYSIVVSWSFSLTSPDLRRFTRPFATKNHQTRQNAYQRIQCHSISHGCCSNFFAGTTLTFCESRFVLFRMSNASSPKIGPFLFPKSFPSWFLSSLLFDDVD